MRFSLIVTSYGYQLFLGQLLRFVHLINAQMSGIDWEVVIVDDATPGSAAQVMRSTIERTRNARALPEIRLVRCAQNLGASGARNVGKEVARGDLVGHMDGDDLIGEGVANMVKLMLSGEHDCVATTEATFYHGPGEMPDEFFIELMANSKPKKAGTVMAEPWKFSGRARLEIMRREEMPWFKCFFSRPCGLVEGKASSGEDIDWWFNVLASGVRPEIDQQVSYAYRGHKGRKSEWWWKPTPPKVTMAIVYVANADLVRKVFPNGDQVLDEADRLLGEVRLKSLVHRLVEEDEVLFPWRGRHDIVGSWPKS